MTSKSSTGRIKATIILLTYNQEKTVGRAMESLLRQTCGYSFEILVADDGSTDGTRAICEKYAVRYPDRIRILPESRNRGIVDNYFDAVLSANGEYIADCAGDDEWLDAYRLEKQIRTLEENPRVMAVSSNVETFYPATNEKRITPGCMMTEEETAKKNYFTGESVLKALFNHTDSLPYVLSSALYRRAPVVRLLEENPDVIRCHDGGVEDVPVIAALAAAGDVMYLPLKGYRYYVDGESASNNHPFDREYMMTADVTGMTLRLADHYGVSRKEMKRFLGAKLPYMAAQVRHADDPALADDLKRRLREWHVGMPIRGLLHLWILGIKKIFGGNHKVEKS